jgi:hypothetical protein
MTVRAREMQARLTQMCSARSETWAAEATILESFRRQATARFWNDPEGAARGRAAAHHLCLRNPGWWWQEYETLRGLFGEKRFASRLHEQLGFDCEAAIAISDAVPSLVRDRMIGRMESARDDPGEFRAGNPAFDWAESVFDDKWKSDPINAARFIPIVWALNTLGEACLLSPAEIAAAAGVSAEIGAAYLERMSLPFGQKKGRLVRTRGGGPVAPLCQGDRRDVFPH